MDSEFQTKADESGISHYKAIALYLKTRDDYIKENNIERRKEESMQDFMSRIYPEHYGRIFEKFCERLKK